MMNSDLLISTIGTIMALVVKGVFDHMSSQKRERHSVERAAVTNGMIAANTEETARQLVVTDDVNRKILTTTAAAVEANIVAVQANNVAVQASNVAVQANGVAVDSMGQITRDISGLRVEVGRLAEVTSANARYVTLLLARAVPDSISLGPVAPAAPAAPEPAPAPNPEPEKPAEHRAFGMLKDRPARDLSKPD